jgi:hypothetical protein
VDLTINLKAWTQCPNFVKVPDFVNLKSWEVPNFRGDVNLKSLEEFSNLVRNNFEFGK